MQEHEFLCEYEPGQSTEAPMASERERASEESLPSAAPGKNSTVTLAMDEQEEWEALQDQRAHRRLGRVLVLGLGLSFLACLLAPWLSGTLLSAPDQLLPLRFLQVLAANRVLVLGAPVICLLVCYAGLRSLTAEVSAMPEHLLDERQKKLRDRAHRSAFKIVSFASLLIPLGFILPHLPWFSSPGTSNDLPFAGGMSIYQGDGYPVRVHWAGQGPFSGAWGSSVRDAHYIVIWSTQPAQAASQLPAASSSELALAGGLLLLTLSLLFSALPMAVLAWRGEA